MKMKIKFIFLLLCSIFVLTGCSSITNNEIYNKTYNVDVDITTIGDAFVPAVEIATEATLGVNTYSRRSLLDSWGLDSVGSCVVYEAVAVLKDGTRVNYLETLDSNNVNYYEYKAVTNAHVINNDSTIVKYTVHIGSSNRQLEATLLGKDKVIDLAVLTFIDTTLITPIKIADSDKVKKGQIVLAVGNPSGYEYYSSATMGIVSFPKRYVVEENYDMEYIQHDAAINPGNSGGSLVNINGELIGINTAKIVEDEVDAIGFAIPSNTVLKVIDRLENNQNIIKKTTGIEGENISDIKNDLLFYEKNYSDDIYELEFGVYVRSVNFGSALLFKVYQDDVIVKVDDKDLYSLAELNYLFMLSEKNQVFTLQVYRDGSYQNVQIKI